MRVLVTGGRDFSNRAALYRVLDEIHSAATIYCIIHGGAPGADAIANSWAHDNVVDVMEFKPDWSRGPKAGPERNEKMCRESNPDLAVVCPGGRGTADCVRRLKKAGVHILEVSE